MFRIDEWLYFISLYNAQQLDLDAINPLIFIWPPVTTHSGSHKTTSDHPFSLSTPFPFKGIIYGYSAPIFNFFSLYVNYTYEGRLAHCVRLKINGLIMFI